MALSPIQIYQQQQNPLAQILQGGNQTITGIFDKAIQIGRDMSNKQLQQEQDMMAMRNTETAMAQRRAENLQQNNEDAMKFARSAFESDRRFGVDQTQQQFLNQRTTAQDLFGNQLRTNADVRAASADTRANEDQVLQMNAVEAEKARIAAERASVQKLVGGGNTETTPGQKPFIQGNAQNNYGIGPSATTLYGGGDPNKRLGEIDAVLGSKTLSLEQEAQLRGERNSIVANNPSNKLPSEAEQRSAAKYQSSLQKEAQQKIEDDAKIYVDDLKAFPPQAASVRTYVASWKDSKKKPDDYDARVAEMTAGANNYDTNRFESERMSARNYEEDKYVDLGGTNLNEVQKKKRREFWKYANGKTVAPSASTPGTAPDTTKDLIEEL